MVDIDAMDADPWPTWPVDKNELRGLVDEIERLRAALQAIAQCPIPARLPGRVELWSLAVQMQETAIAALREASDDAAP
jgi:hypothetical protein